VDFLLVNFLEKGRPRYVGKVEIAPIQLSLWSQIVRISVGFALLIKDGPPLPE
jgi:hypothetical protein